MSNTNKEKMLVCGACNWEQYCDSATMLTMLRKHGMMKRSSDPEMVTELFHQCAAAWNCPECSEARLRIEKYIDFEEDDWGETQKVCCEACKKIIPAERIAILPDTRLCVQCQEKVERGETPEAIYCPKCGSLMRLRVNTKGKTSQYAYYCSDYPKCRTQMNN